MSAQKSELNTQIQHAPKDAQVIMSILKELNIQEYEPRVVNQLLEFTNRYVTDILEEAKGLANHAHSKTIELDDVKFAIKNFHEKTFTEPLTRPVLAEIAAERNANPLPQIKPHSGVRIPPDRFCLTSTNFKLRTANQPKKMTKSTLEGRNTIKTSVKSNTSANSVKRPLSVISKQQAVNIPKPVIKYTTKTVKPVEPKMGSNNHVKMEVDLNLSSSILGVGKGAIKRERRNSK